MRSYLSSRTPWIAVLLLASLGLVAVLAFQAQYGVYGHRVLAEEVLRDYAALAADELLRRVSAEVGYYGYAPATTILRQAVRESGGVPESLESLGELDERSRRALQLVRWSFLYLPDERSLTGPNHPRRQAVRQWLLRELPERAEVSPSSGFATLHGVAEGEPVTVVFAKLDPDQDGSPLVGFELDREQLRSWVAGVVERRPLLPSSLGDGEIGNDALFLRLVDGSGQELFESGLLYPPSQRAVRSLPDDYFEVTGGLSAEVGIDPSAASRLVIGGLPKSRLPLLAALMTLTALLVLAALFLLHKERAVARLRTDFVSRVSHELRTPLTQIRMFAETLRLGRVRSRQERDRSLEIIDRESRRLSGLVENVLQFSRSERDAVQLAPERISVASFLRQLVDELGPFVDPSGAAASPDSTLPTVSLEVADDLTVTADPDALRQAVLNLLDNAFKYGPETQRILVGARADADHVLIWVDDEGPGIPRRERRRVWAPFQRAGNAGAVAGTGIGLAVVQDLIQRHGGTCWIERGKRGGTRVLLRLPIEGPDS